MRPPMRRGACPSLANPMQTGDGLLLRLIPPVGGWSTDAVAALARAACRFGNGVLQITARGNIQARGFTAQTVPGFIQACASAGLAEGAPVVATGPLAGEDQDEVIDPRPLAAAIAAGLPPLAPKVSVLVDGGGTLHLDALQADLRLRVAGSGRWHVWAGPHHLGAVPEDSAADAALRLLRQLAALRSGARMRDLAAEAGEELARDLPGLSPTSPPPYAAPAEPVGVHRLRTGCALGVAFAFGMIKAAALNDLVQAVPRTCRLRPAPDRALLVLSLTDTDATGLGRIAADLGLITCADDPRRRIAACPGAPICAAAATETRPLAERLAQRPDLLPTGMLHLSGCSKGCAHPAPAAITLVGHSGRFALIRGGSARSDPTRLLPPADIESALEASA